MTPNSEHAYPSPLVDVAVRYNSGNGPAEQRVRLPRREQFRLAAILQGGEYALPVGAVPPRVVMDVGANVGLYALYVKMHFPDAVVHCYEPVPGTVALLRHNVQGFGEVHVTPCALGNGDAESEIHLHRANTGQNALARLEGDSQYSGSVPVSRRDAGRAFDALAVPRVDVLKIDTEGCEVEILESLGERVERVDYVLLEYHSDDDRRRIDQLLDSFVLYGAAQVTMHRGTLKYVHRSKDQGGRA